MVWIGGVLAVAGLGFWLHTIKWFLDDPGYGGFDMGSASAFDLRWSRGALFLGLGVGLLFQSWAVGVFAALLGFLGSFCIKPPLGRLVRRRIRESPPGEAAARPRSGFASYLEAEKELSSGREDGAEGQG